ncbi:hypothetical protein ACQUW5_11500 [Legionella sp. CNM-1927-20]|uniref:hypothetical protein n=1 Tax=Legionella sp. CNM-1927-20 TaxID=3422221 RepID=UPI00403AA780
MIILYIPFERANSGDLGIKAQIWRNNYFLHTSEKIKIIYYQDDFNPDEIELNSEICILAHGDYSDPDILANCPYEDKASIINIDCLVSRFEFDFLNIIHHICKIYLYCCGTQQKNHLMANQFQQSLLRSEHTNIHFYQGKLYAPDELGRFLTEQDDKIVSAIPFRLPSLQDEELYPELDRLSVKEVTTLTHANFLEHLRQSALNKSKQIRYKEICAARSLKFGSENISSTSEDVLNSPSRRQTFFYPSQLTAEEPEADKATYLIS